MVISTIVVWKHNSVYGYIISLPLYIILVSYLIELKKRV